MRSGKAGAAYFLRGPDRFLHEECRAAIVSFLPPESREWCLTEFEFETGRLEHALDGAAALADVRRAVPELDAEVGAREGELVGAVGGHARHG